MFKFDSGSYIRIRLPSPPSKSVENCKLKMINEHILLTSPYITLEDIKKMSGYNWDLCYKMLCFHVNENLPYLRPCLNSVHSLQELFTKFSELYFLLFDRDIIITHVERNTMVDSGLRTKVITFLGNIYDTRLKDSFYIYWEKYFTQSFKTIQMIQNNHLLKLYKVLCEKKIHVGDLEFSAMCGSIVVVFQHTTIMKIDITNWTCCEINCSKLDEAKFYINNPILLAMSC